MAARRKSSRTSATPSLHPAPDAVGAAGYLVQFWGERGGKGDGKKAEGKEGGGKKPNVAEIESEPAGSESDANPVEEPSEQASESDESEA